MFHITHSGLLLLLVGARNIETLHETFADITHCHDMHTKFNSC